MLLLIHGAAVGFGSKAALRVLRLSRHFLEGGPGTLTPSELPSVLSPLAPPSSRPIMADCHAMLHCL